jgi:hypothetical protein
MAGYVPLEIDQWSDFSRVITLKQPDGTPQNLFGFIVETQMRQSPYSLNAITIPSTVTDFANGQITMAVTSSNTGNIAPGRYLYDTISIAPGGLVQRLIEGIIVVNPGITHP